jgi:hypothetical protein
MSIDGMYGCLMTDAAVELIRRDERERIIRLLEDDVQVSGNGTMLMDRIRSTVRGENAD